MKENIYEEYCKQVRRSLKKATRKERDSLTEELLDHMESHAEALVELGWESEEARDYAVQTMGDPETVGRQYDEKLSSFWLVCWYILRGVLIVLVVLLAFVFALRGESVFDNLRARWTEDTDWINFFYKRTVLSQQALDIEIPMEHHTLRLFRIDICDVGNEGYYEVGVWAVNYANNPFYEQRGPAMSWSGIEGFDAIASGPGHLVYSGRVEKGVDHLNFYMESDVADIHIQVEIPLDWEEIP